MARTLLSVLLLSQGLACGDAFQLPLTTVSRHRQSSTNHRQACRHRRASLKESNDESSGDGEGKPAKKENPAMAFLRSKGRIGGAANMDFANAMGLDESPSGGTKTSYHEDGFSNVRKSKAAYTSCTTSGVIDDMSEPFPFTSSGNQWEGITDRIMNGASKGSLSRETLGGRLANVLRGTVAPVQDTTQELQAEYGGGFVQIGTLLSLDQGVDEFVDASEFDGVELDVYCEGEKGGEEEKFNVHLRTPACERKFSSYRATFTIEPGKWNTVRLSWDDFEGHGPGPDETPFVPSIRRLGVVSIGEPKEVILGLQKVGFYNVI